MYLRGDSLGEIARVIRETSPYKKCAPVLVMRWKNKYGWEAERNNLMVVANEEILEAAGDDLRKRSQEQLETYKKMTALGKEALDQKLIAPSDIKDVVDLIDKGIKGERVISMGLVATKYIEFVVKVICEEVSDDAIKRRIAERLSRITSEILSA